MEKFNLGDVKVYDDELSNLDIIKDIIDNNNQEEAFYLCDVGNVAWKHKRWLEKMPKVFPHFAVKCNPDPAVVRVIAALNGKYDCASKQEIQLVMANGVSADRIIFANPIKSRSHMEYAEKVGVPITMVDTKEEVLRIKAVYPDIKLVIRIGLDGANATVNFSSKYGCEPTSEAFELIKFTKASGMSLVGFSFHLGSPCYDPNAYGRGVKTCYDLIKKAESVGFEECKIIDIGGGISGIENDVLDQVAESVNAAIEDIDPSIQVISEPGRYYVDSAFTLAALVQGKKLIKTEDGVKHVYYINDGTYGAFIEEMLDIRQKLPTPLFQRSEKKYPSVIWGQTCDPFDCVIKGSELPLYEIGDWMIWHNMGAYSVANSSCFNGYQPAHVYPIIRKTACEELLRDLNAKQILQTNGNGHIH